MLTTVLTTHHDSEILIHPTKLGLTLPSSGLSLSVVYASLFVEKASLDFEAITEEDALLLLITLWCDLIHLHRLSATVLKSVTYEPQRNQIFLHHVDPFAPLSPASELARTRQKLQHALLTWYDIFATSVSEDVKALYYYIKMIATSPRIMSFPSLAGYKPASRSPAQSLDEASVRLPFVSDETCDLAMLVFAHTSVHSGVSTIRVHIWLPVIVFHAALAVYGHARSHQSSKNSQSRGLSSFITVLNDLPWPCCTEMVTTLQGLAAR